MKEVFVLVVACGWAVMMFFMWLDVAFRFAPSRRMRDLFWTFKHRGDPITVYFYERDVLMRDPFHAFVHSRVDDSLVFATTIIDLEGAYGRLSVPLDDYGSTWCWGHEGEEAEALAVARALT